MDSSIIEDVKKIAVFRVNVLGDFIFALPALDALRAAYPQAEIVYLGRAWHTTFVPGRLVGPHRVIAIPPARGDQITLGLVTDPAVAGPVLHGLQDEHFDLALQMHGAGEHSNPFVNSLGARVTAGLKSLRAVPLDRWVPYVYYQNEVARMLEVVSLVGACTLDNHLAPRLPVLERDLAAAAPVLEGISQPYVVLHPGSTDPRRCWSPEKFAAVADYCAAQGLTVVLTGTAIEAERIRMVEQLSRAPVINVCDRLDLSGLVGLLSQAQLFVGNDSGPMHLAAAAGVRTVGLFWSEYILNSMPLPRSRFYPLIAWNRLCPLCGKYLDKREADQPSGPCTHEVSIIEEITPADVIQGVETMLAVR